MSVSYKKNENCTSKEYEFWKNYRKEMTEIISQDKPKLEKTLQNIYEMSQEIGVKPTARYFNIQPAQVRHYIKKYENER